jgi:hypothetical protein
MVKCRESRAVGSHVQYKTSDSIRLSENHNRAAQTRNRSDRSQMHASRKARRSDEESDEIRRLPAYRRTRRAKAPKQGCSPKWWNRVVVAHGAQGHSLVKLHSKWCRLADRSGGAPSLSAKRCPTNLELQLLVACNSQPEFF